jgi:hypothetical protein
MSLVGQPVRALYEISPEEVKRISWLRGPIQGSSIATLRGPPSSKRPWRTSRTRSGRSGSGGKMRWHSSSSRCRSRGAGASYPARARSWSACRVSAPTRRARCWPSCTGEPSRSSMSIWPASWSGSWDYPSAPRRVPNARCTRSLFGWCAANAASWSTGRRSILERSSAAQGIRFAPSARCGRSASLSGRSSFNLLPPQVFFQAHEALVADDDVVDQLDVEDASSLHELPRRLDVLL